MKLAKIFAITLSIYVLIVIVFESLLGYYQPGAQQSLVITTTNEDGTVNSRVVSPVEDDGQLYVSANHWPRDWYNNVLDRPNLTGSLRNSETIDYVAIPVTGEEDTYLQKNINMGGSFVSLRAFHRAILYGWIRGFNYFLII